MCSMWNYIYVIIMCKATKSDDVWMYFSLMWSLQAWIKHHITVLYFLCFCCRANNRAVAKIVLFLCANTREHQSSQLLVHSMLLCGINDDFFIRCGYCWKQTKLKYQIKHQLASGLAFDVVIYYFTVPSIHTLLCEALIEGHPVRIKNVICNGLSCFQPPGNTKAHNMWNDFQCLIYREHGARGRVCVTEKVVEVW